MPDNAVQATTAAGELHEASYWWGVELGLRAAEVILDRGGGVQDVRLRRQEVERHQRSRGPRDTQAGEAEWTSWMVELEMQRWERDRAA